MADRADWKKCVSRSTGAPYYYNARTKKSFYSEKGLPDGWVFDWKDIKAKTKRYFNIFTYETADTVDAIPRAGESGNKPSASTKAAPAEAPPPALAPPTGARVEDTPFIAAKRQELIINIRTEFAKFVENSGTMNGKTKTAKAVLRQGHFIGLAGVYGRWVFNQKRNEGVGRDPLLPIFSPDLKHLPQEMVDAGLDRQVGKDASLLLSKHAKAAVQELTDLASDEEQSKDRYWGNNLLKNCVADEGTHVALNVANTSLRITKRHYQKLEQMYRRDAQNSVSKSIRRIFCVLQRYESLSGDSAGFQMALTEDVFDKLHNLFGVTHECFASPLNCYFPNFCSLFYDTDRFFGSKGSFFDFHPTEGSFEANPPFVDETMTENVKHIISLLEKSQKPLSFVIIVPGWDDDDCQSYQITTGSKYLRAFLTWDKMSHQYKSGVQYKMDDSTRYKDSRVNTFVFIMQNDAGAKKWPVTEQKKKMLTGSSKTTSQAREREGHVTMWQQASGAGVAQPAAAPSSKPGKRKRDENQASAEDHYNNKKLRAARSDVRNRENHSLTHWYKLSNWVKNTVITSHCPERAAVLDLACGAGGDLFKFKRRKVSKYVGVDIAKESLKDEINKVNDDPSISFPIRLAHAVLGTDDLVGEDAKLDVWSSDTQTWTPDSPLLLDGEGFNLVSMQFALHYMMESADRLRQFFKSWSDSLRPGGFFVATSTDAHSMAQIMSQNPPKTDGTTEIELKDGAGRVNCKITFPKATREAMFKGNCKSTCDFGMTCNFQLTEHRDNGEAIDAVNATEWLLPVEAVVQIAAEFNLELRSNMRFDQYMHQMSRQVPEFSQLLAKMKVAGLRQHEWRLASLYTVLTFQKKPTNRVAIIVPFRDLHAAQKRSAHLKQFIPFMVSYLSTARISFRIFIVEQSNDGKKFNRGKLLNTGFDIAKKEGYTSFIYHDVDLLPSENLLPYYATYPQQPIHIARVWERYNANPHYCGGIASFNKADFERINGFPNNFWGWGGEDDEMQLRMQACQLIFACPQVGEIQDLEYMTLAEKLAFLKQQKLGARDNSWKCMVKEELLKEHKDTWQSNGLSDLKYKVLKSTKSLHSSGLASRVTVELPLNGHWSDTKTEWGDK
jgi:SAM-dependent methyltransferase